MWFKGLQVGPMVEEKEGETNTQRKKKYGNRLTARR
jgi:hypothetical protein